MRGANILATSKNPKGPLSPIQLKDLIEKILDDSKAEEIETIDLRGQSSIADFMVVASGQSSRQVVGFAGKLKEKLLEYGMHIKSEGASQGDWIVVDAYDVIVHLFRPEVRTFYNIEKMWRVEPERVSASAAL